MRFKFEDLSGHRYNEVTILSFFDRDEDNHAYYKCRCDCGNEFISIGYKIKNGHKKSCGCRRIKSIISRSTKHGQNRNGAITTEYRTWQNIITRCYNKNSKQYCDYGGRGIQVCERWLKSFDNFFEDMGKKPSSTHSIERIENNGDYSKNNCKWATKKEQNGNTRRNVYVYFNGKKYVQSDFAKLFGIVSETTVVRKLINNTPNDVYNSLLTKTKIYNIKNNLCSYWKIGLF